ncbi:hypothetical protein [Faecalicatena orotica]|jgi:ABC-type lipoprotein export system ATPase subunit|uniref:hypothetical protein n=1 Tax=Clostridia TaxID=186801 RepID=UPI0026A7DC3B
MKKVILQGRNICKVFFRRKAKNNVLNNIDVDIFEKDFTIIMGASGAGKINTHVFLKRYGQCDRQQCGLQR